MVDHKAFGRGWSLLNLRERKIVLGILFLGGLVALSSVMLVGSIFPFLTILMDPEVVGSNNVYSLVYEYFDFQSVSDFTKALAAATLCIIVIATLIQAFNVYCTETFTARLIHTMGGRLLARYLQQSYEHFVVSHTDAMATNVLTEVEVVVEYFIRPILRIWAAFLSSFAIIVLLIWTDPIVAVSAIVVLGGAYCFTFVFTQITVKRLGIRRADANEARFKAAKEALSGIKDIKILGRETAYLDRYSVHTSAMASTTGTIRLIATLPRFAIHGLAMGGVVAMCIPYLGSETLQNEAGAGALLPLFGLFAFASQRLIPDIQTIFASLTEMQFGSASVTKIHADFLLPVPDETFWNPNVSPLRVNHDITLTNVTFDYSGAEKSSLVDINLTINSGERVGIVGSTGAGKSTLVDVILGLLSVQRGQMSVDGTPITDKNLRAWQKSVGYVPQDIFLVDATMAENIALGVRPEKIDIKRVRQAAKVAELDSFINNELTRGYETEIGERGVRLSGGQRQRVGLARALYRDADLIVLDEATSALDNITERAVVRSLEALHRDKTVLVVAHRLSTVRHCDKIIVLEAGRIAGLGTFDSLLADNETFQKLEAAGNSPTL